MQPRTSLPIPHTILVILISLSSLSLSRTFYIVHLLLPSPSTHLSLSRKMNSVCAQQHHKVHSSHQIKKTNPCFHHHIDIPPRKLIFSRRTNNPGENSDMFSPDSPNNEVLLRKFLPYNNVGGEEDDDDDLEEEMDMDPYSSDHFRMFEFKVRRCTRSRSHDWTDCPFAHPGEKARRRDPRRFHYGGTVCPEYRQAGGCSRGDNCEFAHGVFECWLHPARYRTEACKDGKNCKRKVCFFAHTPQQLRILPPNASAAELSSSSSPVSSSSDKKFRNLLPFSSSNSSHCCVYCHSVTSSPTSTLMGISHFSPPVSPSTSISPPLSPACSRRSPSKTFGRYGDRRIASESCGLKKFDIVMLSYKDVVTELMNSMETMNVNEGNSHAAVLGSSSINGNQSWVDACQDQQQQQQQHQQQQFILSPSTPNYTSVPTTNRDFFNGSSSNYKSSSSSSSAIDDKFNDNGFSCPDLGWVNDLLM